MSFRMNKKWQIYQVNSEEVEELQKKYNINKILAIILSNRGIVEEEQINKFLSPKNDEVRNAEKCTLMRFRKKLCQKLSTSYFDYALFFKLNFFGVKYL